MTYDSQGGAETSGAPLVVSGLRMLLISVPLVSIIGAALTLLLHGGGAHELAMAATWIAGLTVTVLVIAGGFQVVHGAEIVVPLVERASRVRLHTRGAEPAAASPEPDAGHTELAESNADQHAAARAELLARFAGVDPIDALLADPDIGPQARELRRVYGREVAASFLERKASEMGLDLAPLTEAHLPADF